MDSQDMKTLNDIYIRLLKNGRDIYDKSVDKTIADAQELESYSEYLNQMNEKLENILDLTDKFSIECINKATEIRQYIEFNDKYKDDPFRMLLYDKNKYAGISWADISEIEDKKENLVKQVDEKINKPYNENDFKRKTVLYKDISDIYGKGLNLGFDCKIPIINRINEIPPALYWYKGDKTNPKGVYICISHRFYAQIPFSNIIDGTKDNDRTCSIKCKYENNVDCTRARSEYAQRYNSDIRECKFAHKGEKYVRIGTALRCPNMPYFGRKSTLSKDLGNLPDHDIKMMLMNALSDLFLSNLWFQKQKNENLVLHNIDTC